MKIKSPAGFSQNVNLLAIFLVEVDDNEFGVCDQVVEHAAVDVLDDVGGSFVPRVDQPFENALGVLEGPVVDLRQAALEEHQRRKALRNIIHYINFRRLVML